MSRSPITIFEVPRVASPTYDLALPHIVGNPPYVAPINITAEIIEVTIGQRGNITHTPPVPINAALNQYLVATQIDMLIAISGSWLNVNVAVDPIEVTTSILGTILIGKLLSTGVASTITIAVTIGDGGIYAVPIMITSSSKANWVKWSNIGSLDFTIWKDNIAGERPLDWKGWICAIKKLGNKVVVYGENGVSLLAPSGNTFGLLPVHRTGLKGKQAVAGDDKVQFFVDTSGCLYSIGETTMKASLFEASIYPEKLDYSEYLTYLSSNIVMSYDVQNRLLYICDGALGYVYSLTDKSLGAGPTNISGIDSQSGNLYVTSPATVIIPTFEICTDIYDLGTREGKVITELELGINSTKVISVAIDYRSDKTTSFSRTDWHVVDTKGKVIIPCYGHEFKFRVKADSNEYFKLDYIMVKGGINFVGERPIPFADIYEIKELNGEVVVYGEGGVAVVNGSTIKEVYKISPKSKTSIAGSKTIHFFVDEKSQLWSLGSTLELLDYSEYLSTMSNQVLSYDIENDLLYICDGLIGFVYSKIDKSFGSGPVNISGIGSINGSKYITSPATIINPVFEICTDIYDMGSRKSKTIYAVELGTDVTGDLWVALDYRMDKAVAFKTLGWHKVSPNGVTNLPCFGIEFRVRVKRTTYAYFELDYIRVNGIVHDYAFQYPYVGR